MAIARSAGALYGTDETTLGASLANNALVSGSEVDVLGDNTSVGDIWLYLVFTSTVAVGTLDIKINSRRVTGQAYASVNYTRSYAPANTTQKIFMGKIPASRYMQADFKNNATGAAMTFSLLYELEKLS